MATVVWMLFGRFRRFHHSHDTHDTSGGHDERERESDFAEVEGVRLLPNTYV